MLVQFHHIFNKFRVFQGENTKKQEWILNEDHVIVSLLRKTGKFIAAFETAWAFVFTDGNAIVCASQALKWLEISQRLIRNLGPHMSSERERERERMGSLSEEVEVWDKLQKRDIE